MVALRTATIAIDEAANKHSPLSLSSNTESHLEPPLHIRGHRWSRPHFLFSKREKEEIQEKTPIMVASSSATTTPARSQDQGDLTRGVVASDGPHCFKSTTARERAESSLPSLYRV
ncbi:hypothetical protein CRG98_031606 [Punica granatum]|uniref:Uncharacterized protein n=1 Tax=Punica granatum TaxID=22663 RepID=A0A2I0IW87_PUNGR|nr:hypothetical protein CRG98_031606 [Punica granatum]